MAKENIETKIENLIENIINDLGYDLYDVEYVKEGKDYYLRIFIDSPKGISIDDCENVNNAIDKVLDDADLIKEQYFLEVSSTGLERNLRKDKHFILNIGNKIEIKLYEKVQNTKVLQGILKDFNDEKVHLKIDKDIIITIDKNNIAMARTIYDWNLNKED